MANYTTLKSSITSAIKQNGNKEITGALLQSVLLAMVDSLGAQFQFRGVATPGMSPGTPDYNVAYIAGPGTYTNFGNKTVPSTYLGVLKFNGTWSVELIQLPVGSTVSVSPDLATGTKIATITVNGTDYDLYAPAGGGGDSYFEIVSNTVSLKAAYTGGITAPQGDITAPAGVVFGKSSGTITVGSGAGFNTLSAALAYASKFSRIFANNGNEIIVEIQSGFTVNEAINIIGQDLSFVKITRAGYTPPALTTNNRRDYFNGTITISDTAEVGSNFAFNVKKGSRGPRIACLFDYKGNISNAPDGFTIEDGSSLVIEPFCGIRNCNFGAAVRGASVLSAKGAILQNAYDATTITADGASIIDLSESMLSIYGDDISLVDAYNGSRITITKAYIKQESGSNEYTVSIWAGSGSTIDATQLEHINFPGIELTAEYGRASCSCSGVAIECYIYQGSILQTYGNNVTSADPSIQLNTLYPQGIIFNS